MNHRPNYDVMIVDDAPHVQPHRDYDLGYPVDRAELEELGRLLQLPIRNINRCVSKGQMREANTQLLLKIGLLTKHMHRMAEAVQAGSGTTVHKLENDERIVTFQVNQEVKDAVFARVLEFFEEQDQFSGEGLHQSDNCLIEAPSVMSDIADKILKFNVHYKVD